MGVTTSFFSATWGQLEASAPGWVRPKYGAFVEKEVLHPFTGENVWIKQHELLSEEPQDCPPDEIHTLIKPERAWAWKALIGGELESLMSLLTNAPEDRVAELTRRALLGPDDAEHWVFEIPDVFVSALARLNGNEIPDVARKWQDSVESTEWTEPLTELLEELVVVASEAEAARHPMFSYVSL